MKKLTFTLLVTIMVSASTLSAQFSRLPVSETGITDGAANGYQTLIESWGTIDWGSTGANQPLGFSPGGEMNIVFMNSNHALNDLGIFWGNPTGSYSGTSRTTISNSNTIFGGSEVPFQPGHFVSIDLNGRESFDFWLNVGYSRSYKGIWSLFKEGYNPTATRGTLSGKEALIAGANGESYHLYSFENEKEAEFFSFFVHFSEPGSEFDLTSNFTPVPEPSTYGIIGALVLAGLIGCRRLRKGVKAA